MFVEQDSVTYRCGVMERILDVSDTWLLFPRYGILPAFALLEANSDTTAIKFARGERRALAAGRFRRGASASASGSS